MTDYIDVWNRYRRLRNAWLSLFVADFGFSDRFIKSFLWRLHLTGNAPLIWVGTDFVFGVALILIGRELWALRCPRCANLYGGGKNMMDSVKTCLNWLFLPKQCVSCSLPKYSNNLMETGP